MAMQTGIGFSKIIILVGAGYTGTILMNNGRLSDFLGQLQSMVQGTEKSGDSSIGDDAMSDVIRGLHREIRQLSSRQEIIVQNGNSGQIVSISSLIVPAATLGALGYGYMWWKGLSFSDLMYVTKRSMTTAVSDLTKHLDQVKGTLAATKSYLTQRIAKLDGKLDEQREISKSIRNEVTEVRTDLSQIGYGLDALQRMVDGLDEKICTLEDKQDLANVGVLYLCNFVDGNKVKMPEVLQAQLKLNGTSRGAITMGLKEISDALDDGIMVDDQPRRLMRTASSKC